MTETLESEPTYANTIRNNLMQPDKITIYLGDVTSYDVDFLANDLLNTTINETRDDTDNDLYYSGDA